MPSQRRRRRSGASAPIPAKAAPERRCRRATHHPDQGAAQRPKPDPDALEAGATGAVRIGSPSIAPRNSWSTRVTVDSDAGINRLGGVLKPVLNGGRKEIFDAFPRSLPGSRRDPRTRGARGITIHDRGDALHRERFRHHRDSRAASDRPWSSRVMYGPFFVVKAGGSAPCRAGGRHLRRAAG